jgi:DNA-binding PadR family transcriptional regulator
VGQVYTTLQRLERDGLVESDDPEGDGPQKGFRITSAGGRELAEWLHTPPGTVVPPRDELVIKVLVAISVPGVDVHELIPPTTTWSWPWSSTPSCSAWRRWCAGWTQPTPG